ncbi:Bromodomain-containing protein 8, partial [Halocaridina rubra]
MLGLKLKQYQVDTWTTREQLCLASAVLRSGDQNWAAVRRNIKMLTTEDSRPNDWYSTKNCALQYAKLLECVDTPKRKRERGDASNETPGEIVTKMLTKQRLDELSSLIAEEKAAHNQQRREIQELESGRMDDQLDALWEQLLKEREEEEEEERKHLQWLKEREEKITAIQQALKHQGPKVQLPPNKKKNKPTWPVLSASSARRNSGMSETSSELDSAVDSPDVQDTSVENAAADTASSEPEQKPTPTSPLLSSLLSKSPILPGNSPSPLSQGRGMRPVFSQVSMALQNLVSSAISGTDSATKSTPSPISGSSTLSRLLDLPPSTPGAPLPSLSDLPTPLYMQKETEKTTSSSKVKQCSQDSKSSGCSSSMEIDVSNVKEEKTSCSPAKGLVEKVEREKGKGVRGGEGEEKEMKEVTEVKETVEVKEDVKKEIGKETRDEVSPAPEKAAKNGKKTREAGNKDVESENKVKVEAKKKDNESYEEKISVASQSTKSEEKPKLPRERESRRKDDKRRDKDKDNKERKIGDSSSSIKEENSSITPKSRDLKENNKSGENKYENNSEKQKQDDDDDDNKTLKMLCKEMESKKKEMKEAAEDFEQENSESKEWTSEEEGNFPRSGKRKISGSDYTGYPSPFISESAPTSPASTHYGDDPESERAYKSWKKPIMILWNEIAGHRCASIFLRPISDEQVPGYRSVVYRPMDLQTIKRNIESGIIRNTAEFQRDMMLMFLNATMYNTSDHNVHQMARHMMKDTISTIE